MWLYSGLEEAPTNMVKPQLPGARATTGSDTANDNCSRVFVSLQSGSKGMGQARLCESDYEVKECTE